jgi:hypothetical protein
MQDLVLIPDTRMATVDAKQPLYVIALKPKLPPIF